MPNDNRMWRVRFDEDRVHGKTGQFWFCIVSDDQFKCSGTWVADDVRFTSFTTEEARDVAWQIDHSKGEIGGGEGWVFEYCGTRVPVAVDGKPA